MTPIFELSSKLFPSALKEGARTDGIARCVTPPTVGTGYRARRGRGRESAAAHRGGIPVPLSSSVAARSQVEEWHAAGWRMEGQFEVMG